MIDEQALFHDVTGDYVSPPQPKPGDMVTITFRAGSPALVIELYWNGSCIPMDFVRQDAVGFCWYETAVQAPGTPNAPSAPTAPNPLVRYFFRILSRLEDGGEQEECYYSWTGPTRDTPNTSCFRVVPGLYTPAWAQGAVMYQIFVERFRNGDPTNDVRDGEFAYEAGTSFHAPSWDAPLHPTDSYREFYGGDLQGVIDALDDLEELGIEVIYFNPLFVSPSCHKYDTQDYDHIDPHFGRICTDDPSYIARTTDPESLRESDALFARLVAEAHKREIRVILDGVFNHCGSFNKWMDRERLYEGREGYAPGAYISAESPYRNYFSFRSAKWPYNNDYDGWWGYKTLPKLDYEHSEALVQYILSVGRKWVSPPYNADGWRLDVGADLGRTEAFNHQFWRRFRDAVHEANPEAIVLAEHYGKADAWLTAGEWDTVMNYDAFMEPVTWFLTGMEKHSDETRPQLMGDAGRFVESMQGAIAANFTYSSLFTAMNQLSNHDHSRFLTRTNGRVGRVERDGAAAAEEGVDPNVMRIAVLIQMTWPGAPCIYYGDEAGMCGWTDPDNRRTYPWGHEDREMLAYHKRLIGLHRTCQELKTGALRILAAEKGALAYGRFLRSGEVSVVLVNLSDHEMTRSIRVRLLGIPDGGALKQLVKTSGHGVTCDGRAYPVREGLLTRTLGRHSAVLLRYTGETFIKM